MLSDRQIERLIRTDKLAFEPPLDPSRIQPSSVDLTLGSEFIAFQDGGLVKTDPEETDTTLSNKPPERIYHFSSILLRPGEFVLGCTAETVRIPKTVAAQVDGKSSLGRIGLFVHITAGFIDPGFCGKITLEFYNASQSEILLTPGAPIAQLVLFKVGWFRGVRNAYGSAAVSSHYQNSGSVQPSWLHQQGEEYED